MHLLKTLLFFVLFVAQLQLQSQSIYPKDYFQSPMDTPLYLSAPFGSLRDNHFHSGMDIRTYEKEGLPVYAIADGYVSRIKYASNGYGKAIYINHPNGYTSVYGHLQKAEGELAMYIKRYQYELEHFDFDHFPGTGKLKVTKGQIIGRSGNSGGSTGPHLHFEIRDTKREEVINPQLFGIKGADMFGPLIKKVVVYSLDANRPVVISSIDIMPNNTLVGPDSVITCLDTIRIAGTYIGVGAEAYDYLTNTQSEYSIYGLLWTMDGKKMYQHKMDRFSFDDSRSINVHIDYPHYKESKIRVQKCFKDDGNRIAIYNYLRNKGRYKLPRDSGVHEAIIMATDVGGRTVSIRFYLKGETKPAAFVQKFNPNFVATFYPGRNNNFRTRDADITVPPKALYDTLFFAYKILPAEKFAYSLTHQIQDVFTPLNSSISISLKIDANGELVKDKLLLASISHTGNISAIGGGYDTDRNGWVTARTSTFANVLVVADSIAPTVKIINSNKEGEVKDTLGMNIRMEDNLSGIASYKMTLNGKWVLTDYDAKNDLLTYLFDEKTLFNTKQEAVITVIDRKGNITVVKKDVTFVK
ncbi:MAG: M23 family metallopeptidase [Bacteroidota bacterium]